MDNHPILVMNPPAHPPYYRTRRAESMVALLLASLLATSCNQPGDNGPAQAEFQAMAGACARFLAAREPRVQPGAAGDWTLTGFSPALVQPEVTRTNSSVTPFVGKLVIKDNEAQAHAPTEAAAQAMTLAPAHLLSNRTHTFIYRFDGQRWHWENGQRLTKIPGQQDAITALALADVSAPAPKGFAGCLPRRAGVD